MTAKEIVTQYLKANGYDGLVNFMGECSCVNGDIMPCDLDCIASCSAGYKVPCNPETCKLDGDCKWHISEVKHHEILSQEEKHHEILSQEEVDRLQIPVLLKEASKP